MAVTMTMAMAMATMAMIAMTIMMMMVLVMDGLARPEARLPIEEDWSVRCEISREALDDHFHGDKKDELEVFRANRRVIEDIARRKYLAGQTEPGGSVVIHSDDL